MADSNTIARPYAQAIFETAREAGDLEAWSETLAVAADLFEDGRVAAWLARPGLSDTQRLDFLTGLFGNAGATKLAGNDRHGRNFLKLLLEYDRADVLPEIAEHFERQKAEAERTVDVTVTSAIELDGEQKAGIAKALEKRLGREIRLETRIDENLIGGAVIRAGDVVIDGSLRARLEALSNALLR